MSGMEKHEAMFQPSRHFSVVREEMSSSEPGESITSWRWKRTLSTVKSWLEQSRLRAARVAKWESSPLLPSLYPLRSSWPSHTETGNGAKKRATVIFLSCERPKSYTSPCSEKIWRQCPFSFYAWRGVLCLAEQAGSGGRDKKIFKRWGEVWSPWWEANSQELPHSSLMLSAWATLGSLPIAMGESVSGLLSHSYSHSWGLRLVQSMLHRSFKPRKESWLCHLSGVWPWASCLRQLSLIPASNGVIILVEKNAWY